MMYSQDSDENFPMSDGRVNEAIGPYLKEAGRSRREMIKATGVAALLEQAARYGQQNCFRRICLQALTSSPAMASYATRCACLLGVVK